MWTARRILALLVAVSLALLPAAGHANMAAKATMPAAGHMATHDMAMEDMTMSAMDDMDCCPHKSQHPHKAVDDCATALGCVLCVGFLAPVLTDLVSPVLLTSSAILFVSTPFDSQTGSPPFRPPRV
jgi:hypothetical protein